MSETLFALDNLNRIPVDNVHPLIARDLPTLRDAEREVLASHLLTRISTSSVEAIGRIENRLITTASGELLIRLYYPKTEEPLPILIYFHGGGFVLGNLDSADGTCRSIANGADCIVISVAYRKAPEHKYPAAREDAFHVYKWALMHAADIGGDVNAIAVGGEDAGGNLAASICLRARDERIKAPIHQLLICPILDNDTETESYFENREARPLNRAVMLWYFRHFLPVEGDAYAFPLQAEDFTGLPPATIFTAEIDPLRDEGELYADRLRESGVSVVNERYLGVTHDFFGLKSILSEARDAHQLAFDNLEHAFANSFNLHEARLRSQLPPDHIHEEVSARSLS